MHIWNRPFYLDLSLRTSLRRAFLIALFVFLFLWVFRPFGLSEMDDRLLPITLGFGLVSLLITASLAFLMTAVLDRQATEKWTAGKEVLVNLIHLFCIGLGNVLFANITGITHLTWMSILTFQFFTLAVGLFPVSAVIFIKEIYLSRQFRSNARNINTEMERKSPPLPEKEPGLLKLSSQNIHEELVLPAPSLLLIKAADNYVEVIFQEKTSIRKVLLRNTLKNMEKDLKKYESFFRCHKSYIVNLRHITRISGNAQGYKLHFSRLEIEVPVSRQYNQQIKALLTSSS